jgi:hypothetical protein
MAGRPVSTRCRIPDRRCHWPGRCFACCAWRDDRIELGEEIREERLSRGFDRQRILVLRFAYLAPPLDNALQQWADLIPVGVKAFGQMHADLIFMDGRLHCDEVGQGVSRLHPGDPCCPAFRSPPRAPRAHPPRADRGRAVREMRNRVRPEPPLQHPLAMAGRGRAKLAASLWS